MNNGNLPLIIIGTQGASKEAYYIIKKINELEDPRFKVVGFVDQRIERRGEIIFDGQEIIGTDETIKEEIAAYEKIGIVIPLGDPATKENLYQAYRNFPNVIFPNIIHPSAIFEGNVKLGIGNIISAGTVLGCDLEVGNFNLINRCCTTGHDVKIGDFNTLNPAAVVSGNVTIGNQCLVGAGAIILQGLKIENHVVLGAGAVLTKPASSGNIMIGIPAKKSEKDD